MVNHLIEEVRQLNSRVQVQEEEIRRLKKKCGKEDEDPFREITETFDSHRNWLLNDMRREREKSRIENDKIRMDELKSEVVEQILKDQKNEIENLKIALSAERETRKREMKHFLEDELKTKQRNEMQRFKNSIVEVLNKKAYTADIQKALREKAKETERDLNALREERRVECEDSLSKLVESLRLLEVSFDVFKREMNDRAEAEKIFPSTYTRTFEETRQHDQIQLENRLREITKEMRKALSRKIDTETCEAILRDKLDEMSFVKYSKKLTSKFRDLESRVQNFSEQDDDSTNVALKGRWIWQSGVLGRNRCATWNIQCTNTDQSNFVFSVGSECIVLKRPGLYKLELCLFMASDPVVSVLVNDKRRHRFPMFNAENPSTSLSTLILLSTAASSMCFGKGS